MTCQQNYYTVFLVLASILLSGSTSATIADDNAANSGPSITIYSSADPAGFDPQRFIAQERRGNGADFAWQVPGFGVVKDIRTVQLQSGINELAFEDVAQFIDPTTVSFVDLTHPQNTSVLEQNFRFDLVSQEKLLEKYIDSEIGVYVPSGNSSEYVTGTLMSAAGGSLVINTEAGLRIVNGYGSSIQLGDTPEGLITRPTLVWKINTDQAGDHKIRTTYQTGGLTWRCDYNLIVNETDTMADIGAWVTLMNLSGIAYQDAKLKLIAGDVQRVQPQIQRRSRSARYKMEAMADAAGFEEKSFFEYHLYTLPRRTDILSNTTQQITLFPTARDVKVEKSLVYYGQPQGSYWRGSSPLSQRELGTDSNKKVDVYLQFKNEEANRMGRPLPKGKVRVYKRDDADGTLEFIGEDLIDHTARNETVLIKLGEAFDVVGERVQTDYDYNQARKTIVETFKITVRNRKTEPQKVVIRESLYRWSNWEITRKSADFEKVDARTIHFPVEVPADDEVTVTYTVRYSW